jgi:hypothetical protein
MRRIIVLAVSALAAAACAAVDEQEPNQGQIGS